jgi:hypothetical protein
MHTFIVAVDFFSGGLRYATESYTIDAVNWYRAEQHALQLSGSSVYDDSRIPDLTRTAIARDTDSDTPDRP